MLWVFWGRVWEAKGEEGYVSKDGGEGAKKPLQQALI